MKTKNVIIICLSIIVGLVLQAIIISSALNKEDVSSRYSIVSHGDTLIIMDNETGDLWSKYVADFEGSATWQHETSPVK